MTPPFLNETSSSSPELLPYPNTFSEEEIHDILGAMNHHDDHLPSQGHEDNPEGNVVHLCDRQTSDPPHDPFGNSDMVNKDHDEPFSNTSISSDTISAESRARARSERKRSREKQRREDVNKYFADLTQLLRQIESTEEDVEHEGSKMAKWFSVSANGPSNRVDLIAKTIIVLERTHKTCLERKHKISDLQNQLEEMKKIAEDTAARLKEATTYHPPGPPKPQVMMMVPMMMSPDTMGTPAAAGYVPQAQMPFAPQQMVMIPQMSHMMTPQIPQNPNPLSNPGSNSTNTSSGSASNNMPNLQVMQQIMQQPVMQHYMMQSQHIQHPSMPLVPMMFQDQLPNMAMPTSTSSTSNSAADGSQHGQQHLQHQQQHSSPSSPKAGSGGNLAHNA